MDISNKCAKKFWSKSGRQNDLDACWNWTGLFAKNGYGRMRAGAKMQLAHRVSYVVNNGKIDDGMFVLHKCDNKKCVNPNHLFLGTQKDNMMDKVAKNRQRKGELVPQAKLKVEQVLDIRKMQGTLQEIANKFGVSFQCVSLIKNNRRWSHV